MLVFIITDSMHFTRHWVQYCHPTLVCKRKSHAYAFFKITSIAKKVLRKQWRVWSYLFCCFWKREQDSPLSRLRTWKPGSTNLLWNSHRWLTSSFLWVIESGAEYRCWFVTGLALTHTARPWCTAYSVIVKRSACLCHYIIESWES